MKFETLKHISTLYGEIIACDTYKLQSLIYLPDVVFDIGANIGVFTHYAHELFPNALIVAVEPHPANFAALQELMPSDNVALLNKGIGVDQILRYPDIRSGNESRISGGESYISNGFGYKVPDLEGRATEKVATQPVLLDELYAEYVQPGQRLAVKLDCEGAENLLLNHPPSVEVLQRADFVTIELHPYWAMDQERDQSDIQTAAAAHKTLADRMYSILGATHRCDSEPPMFYAWRKPDGEPLAGRQEFGRLLAERNLLGNVAEIGVCSGSYSRDILNWGVKHILLVDPWLEHPSSPTGVNQKQNEAYYRECLGHIQGYEDKTTILRMTSLEAAKQTPDASLDFCYIDANHAYEGISVDLPAWWPKVRSGGILAGHDYLAPELGVNRAVTEFAAKHSPKVHLVIEHQRDASFWMEKP